MIEDSSHNALFGLDSSLMSEHQLSDEEFRKSIYDKLSAVLEKAFPGDKERQKIKIAYDRWQFACPFCGDSAKLSFKKRGNFIFKEGPFFNSFKCFNCGTFMPINKFFKEFNTSLSMEAVDYLIANKNQGGMSISKHGDYKESLFNASEMREYGIQIDQLKQGFGLVNVNEDKDAWRYLTGRLQNDFKHFLYDPKNKTLLVLNMIDDKVISFQTKSLVKKKGEMSKYITISLNRIHKDLLKDGREVSHDLDSLSMIYNLYNINPDRPVLATEGPMDSFLLPNCIALLGAHKNVSLGIPLWFVYDDDKDGRAKAIEMLQKGQNVFMWDKLKNEYMVPTRKKWDINDFFLWCRERGLKTPTTWRQYFTNDPLDILSI